ncbi:MAG: response regulator transcription factor [Bacteroidales bacterium]|nr:response regulator transcription factor [Bacteroidales bacterium]
MLKIIIIDDEPHAITVISKIIENYTKGFKIIATADDVASGVETINKYSPDILLLDINLSDGTGFDILNQIKTHNFKLIFITAYDQYAIQAFKFSAFDYILKPVDPDELISVLEKIKPELSNIDYSTQLKTFFENLQTSANSEKKIVLKTHDTIFVENTKDLIYCKADNNYTEFHIIDKKVLVSNTLKHYENTLDNSTFIRCHQSYIVNLFHIKKYDKRDGGFLILSDNSQIPVSASKKQIVLDAIDNLGK